MGSDCYQLVYPSADPNFKKNFSTTYTVKNKNNEIIKQGNFSFSVHIKSTPLYDGIGTGLLTKGIYDVVENTISILSQQEHLPDF